MYCSGAVGRSERKISIIGDVIPVDNGEILRMLDWNNSETVQARGIQLARKCKDLSAFMQPTFCDCNKNVWDNCAKIVCERSDLELQPYMLQLLEWIQDFNWPGAILIFERLKSCSGDVLIKPFLQAVQRALNDKDRNEEWLYHLSAYIRRPDIYKALSDAQINILEKMYVYFWGDNGDMCTQEN